MAGVVALDALRRAKLVEEHALAPYFAAHPRWRGVRGAGRALKLSDARAESPMETRVRMVIAPSGLPRPDLQVPLYDAHGHFVARVDLAYVEKRTGFEYDGRDHVARFDADLTRQNDVWDLDWVLRRDTAFHVYRRPQIIVRHAARALGVPSPAVPASL